MPLAYFITFTTYGTWLHGNPKGSVDNEHNIHGTPLVEPNDERQDQARHAMNQPPYLMTAPERKIVCNSIVTLSRERGWLLLAAHVRSNHVHVVVSADRDPARMMSDIKARASRDLTLAGFGDKDRRRWTRHGSTKHLFREDEVAAKIHYTLNEQGNRMACYDPQTQDAPRPQEEPRT